MTSPSWFSVKPENVLGVSRVREHQSSLAAHIWPEKGLPSILAGGLPLKDVLSWTTVSEAGK